MKKKILSLLIISILGMCICGCKDKSNNNTLITEAQINEVYCILNKSLERNFSNDDLICEVMLESGRSITLLDKNKVTDGSVLNKPYKIKYIKDNSGKYDYILLDIDTVKNIDEESKSTEYYMTDMLKY